MIGTASSLERLMNCPASGILPRVGTTSIHADRGTAIGRYVRRVVGGVLAADALAEVPEEWRGTCANLRWAKLTGGLERVRGEMAYAYNVDTGEVRELGTNLGRRYPVLGDEWIGGTNDLEGARGAVEVVKDVKSGQPVTAAAENAQVLFHALVRREVTGAAVVQGEISYVRNDGDVRPDAHVFGAFDLEHYGDRLRELRDEVMTARARYENDGEVPSVSSGPWCKYCPSKPACPRYTALARAITETAVELFGPPFEQKLTNEARREAVKRRLAVLPPERQAAAWVKARDAEALLEDVTESLKVLAKDQPIKLPGGKELRPTTFQRSDFVQGRALDLLRQLGASDEQIDALYEEHDVTSVRELKDPDAPKLRRSA